MTLDPPVPGAEGPVGGRGLAGLVDLAVAVVVDAVVVGRQRAVGARHAIGQQARGLHRALAVRRRLDDAQRPVRSASVTV